MSKIDCSNVVNYSKEFSRMCNSFDGVGCEYCKFSIIDLDCGNVNSITQKHIDIVQSWSDSHQPMTRGDKFIKLLEDNGFDDLICKLNKSCCYGLICCGTCKECKQYWDEIVEE